MNALSEHPSRFFTDVREILQNARQRAYSTVVYGMVEAYWQIGKRIVEEEQQGSQRAKYGKQLLQELAKQLSAEFGNGFSARNLEYMRKFFLTYRDRGSNIPQLSISQTLSALSSTSDTTPTENISGLLVDAKAPTELIQRQQRFLLSWSHYVFLFGIHDENERDFYEIEAA